MLRAVFEKNNGVFCFAKEILQKGGMSPRRLRRGRRKVLGPGMAKPALKLDQNAERWKL